MVLMAVREAECSLIYMQFASHEQLLHGNIPESEVAAFGVCHAGSPLSQLLTCMRAAPHRGCGRSLPVCKADRLAPLAALRRLRRLAARAPDATS
eukprot:15450848-Alexandrium_andersonii.AAC.1